MTKNSPLCFLIACVLFLAPACLRAEEDSIIPPPMPQKEMGLSNPLPGTTNSVSDGEYEFTLFVPEKWTAPKSGDIELVVHFHGAVWYAIQEHLRVGLKTPMIAFHGGEGSGKYQRPFRDTDRLNRWLKLATTKLTEAGAPTNSRITAVSISSYSAGYGAIREILKSPDYLKLVKRVVVAGSIYADYAKDASGALTTVPTDEQIDPYMPFAQAAARGEKTFVVTFCEVLPGPYAGTSECAEAIARKVGGSFSEVGLDSSPAANVPDFPLIKRFDQKNLHLWGYAGTSQEAHITHARHFADVWSVLNEAKKP